MDYERIASDAILETASYHREDFLRGTEAMAMEQIGDGKPNEFWLIHRDQRDPITAAKLAHLLDEHGAEVMVSANGKDWQVSSVFFLLVLMIRNRGLETNRIPCGMKYQRFAIKV